jgi:hypothetical protein
MAAMPMGVAMVVMTPVIMIVMSRMIVRVVTMVVVMVLVVVLGVGRHLRSGWSRSPR